MPVVDPSAALSALEGIEHLRQLPSLNYLGIESKDPDHPNKSIVESFQNALPGCRVSGF
jgi:hypothetical protein